MQFLTLIVILQIFIVSCLGVNSCRTYELKSPHFEKTGIEVSNKTCLILRPFHLLGLSNIDIITGIFLAYFRGSILIEQQVLTYSTQNKLMLHFPIGVVGELTPRKVRIFSMLKNS